MIKCYRKLFKVIQNQQFSFLYPPSTFYKTDLPITHVTFAINSPIPIPLSFPPSQSISFSHPIHPIQFIPYTLQMTHSDPRPNINFGGYKGHNAIPFIFIRYKFKIHRPPGSKCQIANRLSFHFFFLILSQTPLQSCLPSRRAL